MTTHIFIVNESTFPAHLEYMFAGTSSNKRDWNIALLADIKRVRTGDKVIFYFERVGFYGIFKVKKNVDAEGKHLIYYDKNNNCNGRLGKRLLYRILIEPDEVYSKPINEWDALEKLPDNPRDIIWSLIYRKLKGGRGCTPVTPKESNRLINLIREANNNKTLNSQHFSWADGRIVEANRTFKYDTANAIIMNIEEVLYPHRRAETYLQAFFTENIGIPKFDNTMFSRICGGSEEITWIGNEVFCGVGMQKIDIFTILNIEGKARFNVIELKVAIDTNICNQLERYVKWCLDYLNGTGNGVTPQNLYPTIVLPKAVKEKNKAGVAQIENSLRKFNNVFKGKCQQVKYFEYCFDKERKIIFTERESN